MLSLRDQQYRPGRVGNAVALQSIEGLSIGVDIAVRYALDASRAGGGGEEPAGEHRPARSSSRPCRA